MNKILLNGIVAFGLMATSVHGQCGNPTIIVMGTGEVEVRPDIAAVTVEVRSRNNDPVKAQSENVVVTKKLFAAFESMGIKNTDMGSTSFNFRRDAKMDSEGNVQELGFYATNSVQVKAPKFDDLPKIIAVAIANGATSVGDISYSIVDTKPQIAKARRKAFENAASEAKDSAEAASLKLGAIKTISLGSAYIPPVEASRNFEGGADLPASTLEPLLNPGNVRVTYTVTIEYELK